MRIVDLALKDLSQILRDRKSALFLVIMPVAFTAFMGFALGQAGSDDDSRLPVGFASRDASGLLSRQLQTLLEASSTTRLVMVDEEAVGAVDGRVRQGELAGVVVVPAGFSQGALAGKTPQLTLIVDEAGPAGQTVRQAVQSAVVRALSAAETARMSVETAEAAGPFADDAERQATLEAAAEQAVAGWERPAIVVTVEKAVAVEAGPAPSAFNQSSPGMIVQFAIFGLTTSAMVLVLERKTRTLQRMLTTPMRPAEVIAGHLLAMFGVVFLQEAILVAVGQFGFGVDYLREPLGLLLVMVTLALWVAGLGLFISAMAKGEDQVILWSMIAMFLFSALGGAWFPLEATGSTFAAVGHLTPSAWAMDGFQNIAVRGLGLDSVLLPAGILLAYAGAFFGLAVWRFRFE